MNSGKSRIAIAVLAILLFFYWLWRCWVLSTGRLDLEILTTAAQRLMEGVSPYQISDHAEHTKPPLMTWVMQGALFFPTVWVRLAWDLLSILALVVLGRQWLGERFNWPVFLTGWMVSYGPWLAEMRLGQYNVMLAALALSAGSSEARHRAPLRSTLLGGVAVFEVLMKPTQLLMVPWMFSGARKSLARVTFVILGMVLISVILTVGYVHQWGWSSFAEAHAQWLAFLPQSTAKHLLRPDNLGIPSLAARFLGAAPEFANAALLLGLVMISRLAWTRPLSRTVFFYSQVLAVVLSPMAWRQNYSVLFLLIAWESFAAQPQGFHRLRWLPVAPLILFQCLTSDLLGVEGYYFFAGHGGPLALLLISLIFFSFRLRWRE